MSLPTDSSCEGRVSLHFSQLELSIPAAAGVVDEKGSEYILAYTGPRELDRHPLGGCGSGFGLRVEFLLKTDSGHPRDAEVTLFTLQILSIPFASTPIGQFHQSPPSPVPGDLGRCPSHQSHAT